jgi:hypothetical protein
MNTKICHILICYMYIGYMNNSNRCTFATLIKHCKHFLIVRAIQCLYAINREIFHDNFQLKTLHAKTVPNSVW